MKKEVSIHGQKWDIHLVRQSALTIYRKGKDPEKQDGECIVPIRPSSKLTRKERLIRIDKSLNDETTCETILHECLHAAFPEKNEEWIADTAEDLKNALYKFGHYRKGTDE